MRTGQKILALFLVVAIAFSGGLYIGYQTPRSGVDAQDYIETVFTPYQDGLKAYLSFLDRAQKSVLIACYGFTEPEIVDKLIALKGRGVVVRVLLDRSQSAGKYQEEQIARLKKAGIEVTIGTSPKSGQIMHNKFTVVDGLWVEDGSWNYTKSANKQANVLNFIASKKRAHRFSETWQNLFDHMSKQRQS